jgi:hypothetical protein
MNLARTPLAILRLAFRLGHGLRLILRRQTSKAFGRQRDSGDQTIGRIYVINLDREPDRWSSLKKVRISANRDSRFTKSRTVVSLIPGQHGVVDFRLPG